MTYTIGIRDRRQATLPKGLLQQLSLDIGDSLTITVKGKKAIMKPQKEVTLEALKEIQKVFGNSKVSWLSKD